MGHSGGYFWKGKVPAAQFFTSVPFGLTADEINAWVNRGGGLELWREIYAPFNIYPIPAGNTGTQMFGWFNKEINSLEDVKGLKMRIPGIGGEVLKEAGGIPVTLPGGELFTALQTGVIDATEWVGPYNDLSLGLHQTAKYYYYPGWQEPGGVLEMIANKSKFESLPTDLQEIVRKGIESLNIWMQCEFDSKNSVYLNKLLNEENVQLKVFPTDVLKSFKEKSNEVLLEMIEKDPKSKKIFDAYEDFRVKFKDWSVVSDKIYYEL